MKSKLKKRKCKACDRLFQQDRPLQYVCSFGCSIDYQNTLKANKKAKEWRDEKKILKEKLQTITQLKNEVKVYFQRWVRIRDQDLPCISCGVNDTKLWDGGHFKKAEIYSGTILHEHNCHKQCRKCNRFLGGNELNYREGLIKRYGEEYTENIEKLSNDLRNYKWTREELIEIKNKYIKLIAKHRKEH